MREIVEEISARQLRDSLHATQQMLDVARAIALDAQAELVNLGMEFCGARFDRLQKMGEDLNQWPPQRLAEVIRTELIGLKRFSAVGNPLESVTEANQTIDDLQFELTTQRQRAEEADRRITSLRKQVQSLEETLRRERERNQKGGRKEKKVGAEAKQEQEGSRDAETFEEYGNWFETWKGENNRSYERDMNVLLAIGQTGHSYYLDLEKRLTEKNSISSRTIYRALNSCAEAGLILKEKTASINGRPADAYMLTDKGAWVYRFVTGDAPLEAEHKKLMRMHKSDRHLAFILKVEEQFARLGFKVIRDPVRITIKEDHYFEPDLVVRKDGETFYLEVEGGELRKPSLPQKWSNAAAAGGGCIYLVAENAHSLRRLQSNIIQWATLEGQDITIYETHLAALEAKSVGDTPWVKVKRYASM